MNIKKNLKEGLISDVIGLLFIVGSFASHFIPGINTPWSDVIIGAGFGATIAALIKK
jgi:hypothetical protein